jgi:hypothetical protein
MLQRSKTEGNIEKNKKGDICMYVLGVGEEKTRFEHRKAISRGEGIEILAEERGKHVSNIEKAIS